VSFPVIKEALPKSIASLTTRAHDGGFPPVVGPILAIVHAEAKLLEMHGESHERACMDFDFSNAFKKVSRQTFLDECAIHCPQVSPWLNFCYISPPKLRVVSGP
jgi:hypothetical protein